MEKRKDMLETPAFEQNGYSIISTELQKIAHDTIRLMKWICYYDRSYYGNINYYDLGGNLVKFTQSLSQLEVSDDVHVCTIIRVYVLKC